MLLKDWLEREDMTVPLFAERISRTPETVRRYVTGERIPDRLTMPLVVQATGGDVMPNDFFGLQDISRCNAEEGHAEAATCRECVA